jgi:hypothetical protein
MEGSQFLAKDDATRVQALEVLKEHLPELQEETDDEWANFLLDELGRALDTIVDAKTLFDVLGTYQP